eukprot:4072642-Amphidinium_carterae.1
MHAYWRAAHLLCLWAVWDHTNHLGVQLRICTLDQPCGSSGHHFTWAALLFEQQNIFRATA